MSLYKQARSLPKRFRLILVSFLQRPDLPFADALSEDAIKKAFDDEDAGFAEDEEAVYTPAITLWAFLSQVLFKDEQRSCVAAVARVIVLLVALERGPCSSNTGAYCRARGKLSETVLRRLAVDLADGCERQLDEAQLWHGRHVQLVDGTTVSMPDTPENQEAYAQAHTQREGLGFPVARVVVLLSLATGMLTDMAMGPYTGKKTGETALLRQLLERFRPGDILLGDRYFCSYFMITLLMELDVDFVTRVHQLRTVNFRRGRRLGKGDHVIAWERPPRPTWMDPQTYDRMPASIEVREVYVRVDVPGFRTESFVVITTLTDAAEYAKDDLAELYHHRWLAELDIRAIKITMGMDILRCFGAGDGSQGDVDVPVGLQSDPSDHVAIGAEGGRVTARVEFHRRRAIHRRELAGHRVERRCPGRASDRRRLGQPGRARGGQPTRTHRAARRQAPSETARPTDQTACPSARRNDRSKIAITPMKTAAVTFVSGRFLEILKGKKTCREYFWRS